MELQKKSLQTFIQPLGQRTQREKFVQINWNPNICHTSLPFCSLMSCHFPLPAFSQRKSVTEVTLRGKSRQMDETIRNDWTEEENKNRRPEGWARAKQSHSKYLMNPFLLDQNMWNIICSTFFLLPHRPHTHTHTLSHMTPVLWGSRNKMSYWPVLGPWDSGFRFLQTESLPFNPSHFLNSTSNYNYNTVRQTLTWWLISSHKADWLYHSPDDITIHILLL